MNVKIKRLIFDDFIALEDDENFPRRAEEMKSMDIDNHIAVLNKCGIKPGAHVIDIGAFIGDTAYVFARCGCKVYAFEPFFDAFLCLVYNTRGWPVATFNVPVGNGEAIEFVDDPPLWGNFGMRRIRTATNPSSMFSTRIDDLTLPKIDFMKVDCEGREIHALTGAKETIRRDKPILFVEMYKDGLEASGYSPQELEETIKGLGYSLETYGEKPRWDWICRPL